MAQLQTTVGLIIGSTRSVRLGPSITAHVLESLSRHCPSAHFHTIDLAAHPLPLYDEPVMPGAQPPEDTTSHYQHEYTRRWSSEISRLDALIFVTPQYNWSVPAGLKNALDYLYHEWKGKPAGIVSYGGRGGGKAAGHLRDMLTGLRMDVLDTAPALTTSRRMLPYVTSHGAVSDEDRERWRAEGAEAQVAQLAKELAEKLA